MRVIMGERLAGAVLRWLAARRHTAHTPRTAVVEAAAWKESYIPAGPGGAERGATNDFIAGPQTFGGFGSVSRSGDGMAQPAGLVGTGTGVGPSAPPLVGKGRKRGVRTCTRAILQSSNPP